MRLRKILAAASLLVPMAIPLAASAQTLTFAEAYDRLAKSCGPDIEKLCSKVSLGGGAVKACLDRNQARLSATCKSTSAEVFQSLAKRASAQATAVKVCERDIGQYCNGVQPHDGYRLQCLLTATKVVSSGCKQVIVDAGWN
ncbi:cysteine rich repeat protein [Bosea sp. BK604]|nr:cysteine rich repeat protein [Bosea sp. BK604]